jgi:hypothetical protein
MAKKGIGDLVVYLKTDEKDLKKGLNTSNKVINDFAESAKTKLMAIGGAVAAGFTVSAAWQYVDNTITKLDAIADAAERLQVGTAEFQTMSYAAEMTTSSMEALEKALQRARLTIYEAREGNKTAAESFAAIGVSIKDLDGLNSSQILTRIAQGLETITDDTAKAALAAKIFGKSGVELVPMLSQLEYFKQELEDTNRIIADDAIQAAGAYRDSIDKLNLSMQGMVANSGLIQWLADVADRMDSLASSTARMDKAIKQGASGPLVDKTSRAADFLLDSMSFGYGSDWAAQYAQSRGVNPIRMDLTEEDKFKLDTYREGVQNGTVDTPEERRRKKEEAQATARAAVEEMRKAEALVKAREAAAKAEEKIAKTLEEINESYLFQIEFTKANNKVLEDEYELKKAIYDAEKRAGRELTGIEEEIIRGNVLALQDAKKVKAEKEIAKTLDEINESYLDQIDAIDAKNKKLTDEYELEKAIRDVEKKIERELTDEEYSTLRGNILALQEARKNAVDNAFKNNMVQGMQRGSLEAYQALGRHTTDYPKKQTEIAEKQLRETENLNKNVTGVMNRIVSDADTKLVPLNLTL